MNMDKLNVNLGAIRKKDESKYIVNFEITVDTFDKAVILARDLQDNLENNLKGQTVLNTGPRKPKPRSAFRKIMEG